MSSRVGVGQAAVAFGMPVPGVGRHGQVLLRIFDFRVIFGLFGFEILRGLMFRLCDVRRVWVRDQPFGGIFELRVALGNEFFSNWVIF